MIIPTSPQFAATVAKAADGAHKGFDEYSCVAISCALCDAVLDEDGDGAFHFPSRDEAVRAAVGFGWDLLADGRVICASDEDDHEAVRHA